MFLGPNLLPLLVLAFGAAMLVGNLAALFKPRTAPRREGELVRAPLKRTLPFVLVGLVATIWAIATLVSG